MSIVLLTLFGHLAYPYLRNALLGPAYALTLPAVAWLHARHAGLRASGTVLATALGLAHAVLALLGTLVVDAQPAALFVLGMWWWTIGKMWHQTGTLPRALAAATALGGLAALLMSFAAATAAPLAVLGGPALVWDGSRVALAIWLAALAAALRSAD